MADFKKIIYSVLFPVPPWTRFQVQIRNQIVCLFGSSLHKSLSFNLSCMFSARSMFLIRITCIRIRIRVFTWVRIRPIFGPPGSGSVINLYGAGCGSGTESRSFPSISKKARKLDSYYFVATFYFFIYENWWKCTFKKYWAKTLWKKNYFLCWHLVSHWWLK